MKLISEIARDCLELPSTQRLKLARILIDVSEVEAAWDDEIGARVEAAKNGTAKSQPIADVFSHLDLLYKA